jgi:hypothetical protein
VPLPSYSSELDPAERIFRALRPEIEGDTLTMRATNIEPGDTKREPVVSMC